MPSASIVIPTYNRPQLLRSAVESARAAGTDVEIIVVDDASTDETASVCRELSDIKYIRLERNQGVAGARNVGILASSSEFIAFLDDDDLRLPGSLDLQTAALAAAPEPGFERCRLQIKRARQTQIIDGSARCRSGTWLRLRLDAARGSELSPNGTGFI